MNMSCPSSRSCDEIGISLDYIPPNNVLRLADQATGRQAVVRMSARALAMTSAVILGTLPVSAHAQYVPPWLIVAALSPVLVFLLCIILGFLTRSIRIGALHSVLVLAWIVLFSLASYFVENDYVIWTPLALYTLHTALLVVLIVVAIGKRISGRAPGA